MPNSHKDREERLLKRLLRWIPAVSALSTVQFLEFRGMFSKQNNSVKSQGKPILKQSGLEEFELEQLSWTSQLVFPSNWDYRVGPTDPSW